MAPDLDDLYDDVTLRRLDRGVAEGHRRAASSSSPSPSTSGSGSRTPRLAASVLVAALLGLRDVLEDDERRQPVIEVAPDPGAEPVRGVSLHFVPGVPEATVAVVR